MNKMQNPIHLPTHPIWSAIRLIVVMAALVIILYLNATSFDVTELKTIIGMFLVAASAEGLTQYFRSVSKVTEKMSKVAKVLSGDSTEK